MTPTSLPDGRNGRWRRRAAGLPAAGGLDGRPAEGGGMLDLLQTWTVQATSMAVIELNSGSFSQMTRLRPLRLAV